MEGLVTISDIQNILVEDILPAIKNQLPEKAPMWQIFGGWEAGEDGLMTESKVNPIQAEMETFKNNSISVIIKNGRSSTNGIAPGEKFTYGKAATGKGTLSFVTAVGAFLIPKSILKQKNDGTIVNTLNLENDEMKDALAMSLNRQCYGDGSSTLAFVAASGSSKTVTLKPKATAASLYNGDIPMGEYFAIGDKVKIGANAITTVDGIVGDNSITVKDTQTLVANTTIKKYNASDVLVSELSGLGLMVDDSSTYLTINPATDASWKAFKNTNNNTAKTFAKGDWNIPFQKAKKKGSAKLIVCNMTEFNAYGNTLTDMVRAEVKDVLSGGWNGLSFMGGQASILLDTDCPDDRVYFLSPEVMFKAELYPLEFEPMQRVGQQLDYESVMSTACNTATYKRGAHSVLTNRVG